MATESRGDTIVMMTRTTPRTTSLVVCSLEPWTEVRRRIRILVDELVDIDPYVRVLYVAPAVDIPHEIRLGRPIRHLPPKLEQVGPRVHVLRPRKWLPPRSRPLR